MGIDRYTFIRNLILKFIAFSILIVFFIVGIIVAENKGRVIRENYKKNISIEIQKGKIIYSSKEVIEGIFERIKYETCIEIDNEIIISKNKEIYDKSVDKIGEEVEVEIKNYKLIDRKYIVDIK